MYATFEVDNASGGDSAHTGTLEVAFTPDLLTALPEKIGAYTSSDTTLEGILHKGTVNHYFKEADASASVKAN